LGITLDDLGDFEGALEHVSEALRIDRQVQGSRHIHVARELGNASSILRHMGRIEEALAASKESLSIVRETQGDKHPIVATALDTRGILLLLKGDLEEATDCFEEAFKIRGELYPRSHPAFAFSLNNLAGALHAMANRELADGHESKARQHYDDALQKYHLALAINEMSLGRTRPQVATNLHNLSALLIDRGDVDGGVAFAQQALQTLEALYEPNNPLFVSQYEFLRSILWKRKDWSELVSLQQRVLERAEITYGQMHVNVAPHVNNLGCLLRDRGDLDGARALFTRALKIFENTLGRDDPSTKLVRENLDKLGPM
jgi:tetratricopeptide (TPR) repeat protein